MVVRNFIPNPFPCSFFFQSANFGKGFLGPDVPIDVVNEFVEMCHQLRVLNNVRGEDVGIPVTYRQYPYNTKDSSQYK